MKKRKKMHDVLLPEFPREGKFQTKEEVDAYFASDKIQCLLCGKWFDNVHGNHLKFKHGITSHEYRERFGLPWYRGLTGKLFHESRSKTSKKLWNKRDKRDKRHIREALQSAKRTAQRHHQPFHMNTLRKRNLTALGRTRMYEREDYEAILERMRKEKRTLKDVCGDPDMPSAGLWTAYTKNRPELRKKARKIHHGLSYTLQARMHDLSPRFARDCRRLRYSGMSMKKISVELGVSKGTVTSVFLNDPDSMRPIFGKIGSGRKWRRKDFEAILDRMRAEQRILHDVCKDPDLPASYSWRYYLKKHPEFADKAREIHFTLSYPSQFKSMDISPRFRVDCERLWAAGMILKEIGHALGADENAVRRALQSYFKKYGSTPPKSFTIYHREDFEAILERMRSQERLLKDVCGDYDMPKYTTWRGFVIKHPEFKEKHRQAVFSLPYHVQLEGSLISPELLDNFQRMRSRGMNNTEIANEIGISVTSVKRVFRKIQKRERKRRKAGKRESGKAGKRID